MSASQSDSHPSILGWCWVWRAAAATSSSQGLREQRGWAGGTQQVASYVHSGLLHSLHIAPQTQQALTHPSSPHYTAGADAFHPHSTLHPASTTCMRQHQLRCAAWRLVKRSKPPASPGGSPFAAHTASMHNAAEASTHDAVTASCSYSRGHHAPAPQMSLMEAIPPPHTTTYTRSHTLTRAHAHTRARTHTLPPQVPLRCLSAWLSRAPSTAARCRSWPRCGEGVWGCGGGKGSGGAERGGRRKEGCCRWRLMEEEGEGVQVV